MHVSLLTPPTSADESQVIELCNLILHERGRVSQFGATILIVSRPNGDQSTIAHLAECHHFERHRESLVRTPVSR